MAYVNTINAIWVWGNPLDYDPTTVANNCTAGKINIICPVLGHWNSNGTISFDQNQTSMKNWIASVKSKNPNFKVLGNVVAVGCYFPPDTDPDISSVSMRTTIVNNIVNCVNNLGLDGWNEDSECAHLQTNGYSNLLDLWNKMGVALKAIGKISSACVQTWGEYVTTVSKNVVIDYLFPMCYNGSTTGSSLQNCINTELNASNSPVIIGLGQYQTSLSSMISAIDSGISSWNTTKLRGFCIFQYGTMTNSDWTTWNNWPTKNPGVTNPILTSITIAPASISVSLNGTAQLTATCKDQNGSTMVCPTLTWSSTDQSKATVDSTGKITGLATGATNITAKSGTVVSNISTVTITSPSVLTSIALAPATASVNINGIIQLVATCKDQNTNAMTCPMLTWTSNNLSIATVDSTGKVVGIATGSANVTTKAGIITSNPSIITVTQTPPLTGNLLLNPGFELGTTNNPANWKAVTFNGVASNYSFTYPEVGRTGNAVAIQKKVANNTRAYYAQTVVLPESISSFILSGYIKTSNVIVDAHIQIDWYNASGWMAYNQSNVITGTVTNWIPVQVIAPKPSGATYASIDLVLYSTGSDDKAWFDDIYFGDSATKKNFSVSNVAAGGVVTGTGVLAVLDPAGTFTKDQACTEVCRLLGLI
jgi:hypothetical protein